MLRRFLPQRISGQIALLIVAAVASIYAVLSVVFLLRAHEHAPRRHPADIEMAASLLDATAPTERAHLFATIAARYPDLALRLDQSKQAEWPESSFKSAGVPEHGFGRNLPPGIAVRREGEG